MYAISTNNFIMNSNNSIWVDHKNLFPNFLMANSTKGIGGDGDVRLLAED